MSRRTIILILVFLGALYLAPVNNHWAVKPDSGIYLSLGRSLAEGRGMTFNGRAWWGIPPGLPLLVAGCRLVAGPAYWPVNLAVSLMGLGTAVLAYLLAHRLAEELPARWRPGFAAAVLLMVGTSARLLIDSTRILTDVPFAFFIVLGFYAMVRSRRDHWAWCLGGTAAFALATFTRLPGLVFFGGAVLATALEVRRPGYGRRLAAALVPGGVLAALFVLWMLVSRDRADPGTIDYLGYMTSRLGPPTWETVAALGRVVGEFPSAVVSSLVYQKLEAWHANLVPTALAGVGLAYLLARKQFLPTVPVLAYLAMLAARGGGSAASRYLLPAMPLLVCYLLTGVLWLRDRVLRGRVPAEPPGGRRPPGGWAVAVTVGLAMALGLPKVAREIYRMRHPRFYEVYEGGQYKGVVTMGRYLGRRAEPGDGAVLAPDYTIVHYLSRLPVTKGYRSKGRRVAHYTDGTPEAFVRAAVKPRHRYVAVPTDAGAWSKTVAERLAETGLFEPPRRFDGLALYERRGTAAAPAPGADAARSEPAGGDPSP